MSLDNLVKFGQLEKVAAQASDIERLLDAAQRALRDADAIKRPPEAAPPIDRTIHYHRPPLCLAEV